MLTSDPILSFSKINQLKILCSFISLAKYIFHLHKKLSDHSLEIKLLSSEHEALKKKKIIEREQKMENSMSCVKIHDQKMYMDLASINSDFLEQLLVPDGSQQQK